MEQIRLVHEVLNEADAPVTAETVARAFQGRVTAKKRARIEDVFKTLVTTGAAQTPPDDPQTFFVAG